MISDNNNYIYIVFPPYKILVRDTNSLQYKNKIVI